MATPRLSHALQGGLIDLPEAGDIAVLNPPEDVDFGPLDGARLLLEQGFFPTHAALARQGFRVVAEATGRFGAAIVFLPRARDAARALVARAVQLTGGGLVLVDGQKTDGIGAMAKALKAKVAAQGSYAKAHGRLIWFSAGPGADGFADWQAAPRQLAGGFVTRPGVFSADAPDPGSQALLDALPQQMKGRGADLGAGWGYLARGILGRAEVTGLDLVEADHLALNCARENVTDPRARFHWADATLWRPDRLLDFVVSNPPFHTGRAGTPELGQAFIAAAAAMLAPRGSLWLVANRHLPYEAGLNRHFRHVDEIATLPGFKLFHASAPRPNRRGVR